MTGDAPSPDPITLADLHLPPNFVADHCIRTLAYHGALAPTGLARRWRVPESIAAEVVESLKTAGFVDLEAGQHGFERSARVRLTAQGEARVEAARRRTWYAGPLPISLASATDRMGLVHPTVDVGALAQALEILAIPDDARAEIGQAVSAASVIALTGAAQDEQATIAASVGRSHSGKIDLPYAVFAAGSVLRMFDARWHHATEVASDVDGSLDILRTRTQAGTQWAAIAPPVVTLAGGIREADAIAAFDDDARFYVAPPAASAHGGVLAVFDAGTSVRGVAALAEQWLIPGRHGSGLITLRTGERVELPWRAATLLLSEERLAVAALDAASPYVVDISALSAADSERFLAQRLAQLPAAVEPLGAALSRAGAMNRPAAARAARYIRERASFDGGSFDLTESVLTAAVDRASLRSHDTRRLSTAA